MARANARAGVAVEVLVEEQQVAPVRILLEHRLIAEDGTTAAIVTEEQASEPA